MEYIGLNNDDVQKQFKKYGYNQLRSTQKGNWREVTTSIIREPLILILILCGTIYMIVGSYDEGIILLSTILLISFITFFQQIKTQKALDALKKLSSPRALVIRSGKQVRISGKEIVPNDLVMLNEGDRIPADGLLVENQNLTVDESILTGESLAILKSNDKFLYSGTLVVKGRGVMQVTDTGSNTQLGRIGKSLGEIKEEQTPLQKEMKHFIRLLGVIGMLLCLVITVLFYYTRRNIIQAILNGLSTAIALLPEEFPVVLTVFLALGAWRLSKRNVLTRKSSAIETLGSATVLCCDKTGTITQNNMAIATVYCEGIYFDRSNFKSENLPFEIIETAALASHPNSADPMEKALIEEYQASPNKTKTHQIIKEFSFSNDFRVMSCVHKFDTSEELFVAAKGAPEDILQLCKLSIQTQNELQKTLEFLASKGYRILGVANAIIKDLKIPEIQEDISFHFCGFVALEDPIRPEVKAAVDECHKAGIRIIIITGDFKETAINIAQQIGLNYVMVLNGDELDKLSDKQLDAITHQNGIISRVKPEQKLRIVESLKRNGEIVAMTGDGVNDAPALKAAHIGIAMGNKGTDVARESASLVLLDDNFASIVGAIRLGRRIYDNLQKAMSYILSIHIPIIGLTLIPAFNANFIIVLMPLHIVFLELIIDPISSVAFESEGEENQIMERVPNKQSVRFFGFQQIFRSIFEGILLLGVVLSVIYLSKNEGHSDNEIRAICFSSLIISNIFLIFSKLSKTHSVTKILRSKNWSVKLISLAALLVLIITITIPEIAQLFQFSFPGLSHFFIAIIFSFVLLLILETQKYFQNK